MENIKKKIIITIINEFYLIKIKIKIRNNQINKLAITTIQ